MAGPEDEYARRYMSEGGLLHESKAKAPLAFHLLVLSPVLLSLAILSVVAMQPGASASILLAALPALFIAVPVWLLFAVLRATVTKTHVHIQYGLFGPKIPLENVESAEAVAYDWKKYGGWGIRRARDGSWAYNMMGDQGRAVRLVWTDKKGNRVTTLLSAPNPDGLVRAIKSAKAAANPPPKNVRVRAPLSSEEMDDALREAEASLEEGADEKRSRSS